MKNFTTLIRYLKCITLLTLLFSAVSVTFQSFDPWHSLEQLIIQDLYGASRIPDWAFPLYRFAFMLFAWISVSASLTQYALIHYALAKKESWAYWTLFASWLLWIAGASVIACTTGANTYFYSIVAVTILFVPPLILLKKYFPSK